MTPNARQLPAMLHVAGSDQTPAARPRAALASLWRSPARPEDPCGPLAPLPREDSRPCRLWRLGASFAGGACAARGFHDARPCPLWPSVYPP